MLSLPVRSHWKLALKSLKKAIKITIKEVIRDIRLINQMNKKSDNLLQKRNLFATIERFENEQES